METRTWISIRDFCTSQGLERQYILELQEFGLIKLKNEEFIDSLHLSKLEKVIRFHREMKINLEGIDVILNLLDKLEDMNHRMRRLENRLEIYEYDFD